MSGSKNERAHEIKVRERAHMSAITLTRAHDQHLYMKHEIIKNSNGQDSLRYDKI